MPGPSRHCLAAAALLLIAPALTRGQGTPEAALTYEQHVRPIFKALCFQCHGEEEHPKAGLDLRLVRRMTAGGKGGPAVVPGKPGESPLWDRVEADEMPKGEKKLTAGQKEVVRRWIAEGARTARPEPADPRDARFTEEELSFWAFQPVRRPAVPDVRDLGAEIRNPIDAFLAAKLGEKGLCFSPAADRRTLIRRATFDLTGLPPTPEEVEAFTCDAADDAYERLIDRLL